MPTSALALALAAAFVHALWNLLLARSPDVWGTSAVALPIALVAVAPLAALTWSVDAEAIPYVVASGALELAYFGLLASAYGRADLSLVYPLARGLAPVLVLVAAFALLGETTGVAQAVGVVLVAIGVLLVRGPRGHARTSDLALVCAIAACIASYTLVDKSGIEHASALSYLVLVLLPSAIVVPAAVAASRGRRALAAQVRPATLVIGIGMIGAYGLVLLALRLAPAAPVAAVRETSIVIGVALAAPLLHERVGPRRLAGAAIVAAGVIVIGVS